MKIKDQLNRTITLTKTPKRIVSLVPSQTELLVDLGLEDSLVGVTRFCVHPNHLRKEKVVVGGTKNVHISKVEALQPDIMLCNKEENTLEIVEQLEQIAPVHISDISSIDDTLELINEYGTIFNCKSQATRICEDISSKDSEFKAYISGMESLKVAYFIWKDPWMVGGNSTFINSMLKLNGFENVFQDFQRYPEISINNSRLKQADLILLSSEPFPFKDQHIADLKELYPETKIKLVDGEFFSWYGSRLLKAFDYFKIFRTKLE